MQLSKSADEHMPWKQREALLPMLPDACAFAWAVSVTVTRPTQNTPETLLNVNSRMLKRLYGIASRVATDRDSSQETAISRLANASMPQELRPRREQLAPSEQAIILVSLAGPTAKLRMEALRPEAAHQMLQDLPTLLPV